MAKNNTDETHGYLMNNTYPINLKKSTCLINIGKVTTLIIPILGVFVLFKQIRIITIDGDPQGHSVAVGSLIINAVVTFLLGYLAVCICVNMAQTCCTNGLMMIVRLLPKYCASKGTEHMDIVITLIYQILSICNRVLRG